MFKNMKLGTKITVGFAALLVIATVLGCLAIWQMNGVKTESLVLSEEYIPSVAAANLVERNILKTMYSMVSFAFTDDQKIWETGKEQFATLKESLQKTNELAQKAHKLTSLKTETAMALAKCDEYEKLCIETKSKNDAISQDRKGCEESIAKFTEACNAYITDQDGKLETDIAAIVRDKNIDANTAEKKLDERKEKIAIAKEIYNLGIEAAIASWRGQAMRDTKVMESVLKNFEAINTKVDQLKAITKLDINMKQLDQCKTAAAEYKADLEQMIANWKSRDEMGKLRREAGFAVGDMAMATANKGMQDTTNVAKSASTSLGSAANITIGGLIAAVVIGIVLALGITRSITGPINRIIGDMLQGAEQVSSAAGQVSAASQSLAEGATEQAAGLEETSSSLEEMSSMTKQNSDNAQKAASLAAESRKAAENGAESMSKMSAAINEIQKSSSETAKIIKVIDEIAFQTNLLSLNAAVEAARAGEAGKGFAVVAEEVRNLAMRSAEAAKNTSSLIEGAVKNAKNGVDITGEVAKTLEEIVSSVSKTSELVNEIAASSSEQAKGIEQVNTAITQMDKVTQANAANAEESASASEELNAQAQSMNEIVNELVNMVGRAESASKSEKPVVKGTAGKNRLKTSDKSFHQIIAGEAKAGKSSVKFDTAADLCQDQELKAFNS